MNLNAYARKKKHTYNNYNASMYKLKPLTKISLKVQKWMVNITPQFCSSWLDSITSKGKEEKKIELH